MLICLTPTKNEACILDRFLRCASLWADHIVVADQESTDESREIAGKFPKVKLVENDFPAYSEAARQQLLLEAARRVAPNDKRILIALDADEMLSADWQTSPDWARIQAAEPGTVLRFRWVNVMPGFERAWIPKEPVPLGFVDDGSPHRGEVIHSVRVPFRPNACSLTLENIEILHYQYVDWERMESKQRWYQCWERMNVPRKRAVTIFRQYHGMYGRPREEIYPFKREWIEGYERAGIDMTGLRGEPVTWWDREIIQMLQTHGPRHFRKQDIWRVDWAALARQMGYNGTAAAFRDPRNRFEKWVHAWLLRTQPRAGEWRIRWIQRALAGLGW